MPLRDGQAQPRAALLGPCQNRSKMRGRSSGGMPTPVSVTAKRTWSSCQRPRTRNAAALRRELDGVAHQVREQLQHAVAVGESPVPRPAPDLATRARCPLPRHAAVQVPRFQQDAASTLRCAPRRTVPGLHARHVQQVLDQPVHAPAVRRTISSWWRCASGASSMSSRMARAGVDGAQRVLQVVRHGGQHVVAGPGGRLRLLLQLLHVACVSSSACARASCSRCSSRACASFSCRLLSCSALHWCGSAPRSWTAAAPGSGTGPRRCCTSRPGS
jgi:hypothetical protein